MTTRASQRISQELPTGSCAVCYQPLRKGQTFWCSLQCFYVESHFSGYHQSPTVSEQAAKQKAQRERELTRWLVPVS